jgi:16S rRNA (uracil1498-N3)-methyltransferase
MNRAIRRYRIYVNKDLVVGCAIELDGDVFHYLINVLRLRSGDQVVLFNGREGEFCAHISDVKKRSILLSVDSFLRAQIVLPDLALAMPALRPSRMGFLFEKICEIGATDFYPIICERSQYAWGSFDKALRQIIEAAEQCERLSLIAIHDVMTLKEFLDSFNGGLFWAYERSASPNLGVCEHLDAHTLLIGPEGGFSENEVKHLRSLAFVQEISLGGSVLRSETAAIVGLYTVSQGSY